MDKKLQDLAWSVLPKEYKEEVKKEYYDCKHCNADVCAIELETVFGKHNLTSDVEGEEMLIIPRKKVQELYAQLGADAIANRKVGEGGFVLSGIAQQVALFTLFGGKCLKK